MADIRKNHGVSKSIIVAKTVLKLNVYYKTNNSDDYVLFRENLSTKENYNLDFTSLEFSENEYITETCFDFGKVDIGFREDIKPTMECKSFDTLKDNDTFTNHTKTVGVYFGVTAEANSKWTTNFLAQENN